MSGKKSSNKWIKWYHEPVRVIVSPVLRLLTKIQYGIKVEKFTGDKNRNYFILSNHQTAGDQFFIGVSFPRHVYYIASEDIFSNGFTSKLIKFLVNPIPFNKAGTDIKGIKTCVSVAREGGNVALFPEGNRTYSGIQCSIKPATVKLVRLLKLPVAFFNIQGGYGVQPRWAAENRKGEMHAGVTYVMEPEEYAKMTDDELYEEIKRRLDVDENGGNYESNRLAEYAERLVYVCPECGLSTFKSHADTIECEKCGAKVRYTKDRKLEGVRGSWPYLNMAEWYKAQIDFVNNLDLSPYLTGEEHSGREPIFEDTADIFEVILYDKKYLLKNSVKVKLMGDAVIFEDFDIPEFRFDDIEAIAVIDRNKLNIKIKGKTYQFEGDVRYNAIKYLNIYQRYINQKQGVKHDEFLGL